MARADLSAWLTAEEHRDVEGVLDALSTMPVDGSEALVMVMPELHRLLGLDLALSYRPTITLDGIGFDFFRTEGDIEADVFEQAICERSSATDAIAAYSVVRPEASQRNRAVDPRCQIDRPALEATATAQAEMDIGVHHLDEMRVLVCENASILAWVGGYRAEPFDERDRTLLQALVAPLARRLEHERRLARDIDPNAMVESVMDALSGPAFVVNTRRRTVEHTNSAGRSLLEAGGARREIRAALAGSAGYRIVPIDGAHGQLALIVVEPKTHDLSRRRIEAIRARWRLTRRQTQVLTLLVQGESNPFIAQELGIARRTVEVHVSALFDKSGFSTRAELVSAFWQLAPTP